MADYLSAADAAAGAADTGSTADVLTSGEGGAFAGGADPTASIDSAGAAGDTAGSGKGGGSSLGRMLSGTRVGTGSNQGGAAGAGAGGRATPFVPPTMQGPPVTATQFEKKITPTQLSVAGGSGGNDPLTAIIRALRAGGG